MRYKFWIVFCLAVILGILITWIDSRPTWDDTGITAFMIVFATAICGFIYPKKYWIWALLVGIGIPLVGLIGSSNFTSFLALIFAFVGAFAGIVARKIFTHPRHS